MNLKTKTAFVLSSLLVSGAVMAQAKAPEPDYTLGFNVGAVSDYRYRGISQTRFMGTVQAGVDFAHKNGFYLGAWGSGIKWIKDAGATDGSLELDLYGGYKGAINSSLSYDVGYLRYQYVSNTLGNVSGFADANTDEIYGALTYGPVTAKYSHSVSNLFGNQNSSGSGYLDLSANFDLGSGFSLTPHVGRQVVANNDAFSYTDYSLTLGKDFGNGLSAFLTAVGTNAVKSSYVTPSGEFTGKDGAVVGVKYSF